MKYRFTVDGRTYFGRATEPEASGPWYALRRSGPILIRFIPSNPAINHPAAWEWSALMYRDEIALWIYLLTLWGIGLALLMRDHKLAREGKVAAGVVIRCTPRNRGFRVEYEFRTEEGVSLKGKCVCADPYEAGATIWILYLPRKPKRNRSYPLAYYSAAD